MSQSFLSLSKKRGGCLIHWRLIFEEVIGLNFGTNWVPGEGQHSTSLSSTHYDMTISSFRRSLPSCNVDGYPWTCGGWGWFYMEERQLRCAPQALHGTNTRQLPRIKIWARSRVYQFLFVSNSFLYDSTRSMTTTTVEEMFLCPLSTLFVWETFSLQT